MYVAVQLEFKADRKEPLGDLIRRVAALFESCGLHPDIRATFRDAPAGSRRTSAVARALRKHRHLAPLERNDTHLLGAALPRVRRLTNSDGSIPFALSDVVALADGVPRSLPFHAVSVHFGHADFGPAVPASQALLPGINVGDGWWVNGRTRSLSALYAVEAEATSKTLPDPPATVGTILGGLGKAKRTAQLVAPEAITASPGALADSARPAPPREHALVGPILAKYQRRMKSLIGGIDLPYDLPPAREVREESLGASGPLKPTLVDAFARRGYDCRGGSGAFTLRRRTAANHVIELELDVGTYSRSLTFMFHVLGPDFIATLMPPVTARDAAGQYPIGDTANWQQIVANMAAIVDELERTFVAEIESAVDPAPAWFEPGRG
jgi:hypothetical protein